ncbi:MAG TPA: hypothetical protein VNN80_07185, partial [Polyangiaceae bacterium]|nr:hypothetical protein [Polyangiaceae bacterium]
MEVSARAPSVSVWYRSSDGCPSGPAFLARLKQLGHDADLAGVGDRVDFVVTLAADSPNSAGRLERQTERGTVAIRELQAPRCEDVAEALALNIELALQAPEPAAPAQAVSANPAPPGALGANHSSPDATAPRDGAAAGQQANALRLGADAGLAT